MQFGFINLNKPEGFTSHDCVSKIRRLLNMKKVGHGGTLDPLATGVLPIAVGRATRLLQFLPTQKEYYAQVRFGMQTTTDDLEGEIIRDNPVPNLTLEEITPLLKDFLGQIKQIPPAYSAIQQDGKRLYDLARAGIAVDVPERTVEIHEIEVINWYPGEYPELTLRIACGGGTYIRAIARDLGEKLKIGGTLASLQRTLSCNLCIENSLTFAEIETQIQNQTFTPIPPDTCLNHLLPISLAPDLAQRWRQGQKIPLSLEDSLTSPENVRVYQTEPDFLGIGELIPTETGELLIPKTVIQPSN